MSAFLFWGRKWVVIWVSLADGEVGEAKREADSLSPKLAAEGLYPDLPAGCRCWLRGAPRGPICQGVPPASSEVSCASPQSGAE